MQINRRPSQWTNPNNTSLPQDWFASCRWTAITHCTGTSLTAVTLTRRTQTTTNLQTPASPPCYPRSNDVILTVWWRHNIPISDKIVTSSESMLPSTVLRLLELWGGSDFSAIKWWRQRDGVMTSSEETVTSWYITQLTTPVVSGSCLPVITI